MFNRCICSKGRYLVGNQCKLLKDCDLGYMRLYNNRCIKKCPDNQIRIGNEYKICPRGSKKIEIYNTYIKFIKKNL